MRANRRTDTKPELALRRELHRQGLRYRKDYRLDLEGARVRPDIAFTARRVAVFVDGCFWHVCPEHGTKPAVEHLVLGAQAGPQRGAGPRRRRGAGRGGLAGGPGLGARVAGRGGRRGRGCAAVGSARRRGPGRPIAASPSHRSTGNARPPGTLSNTFSALRGHHARLLPCHAFGPGRAAATRPRSASRRCAASPSRPRCGSGTPAVTWRNWSISRCCTPPGPRCGCCTTIRPRRAAASCWPPSCPTSWSAANAGFDEPALVEVTAAGPARPRRLRARRRPGRGDRDRRRGGRAARGRRGRRRRPVRRGRRRGPRAALVRHPGAAPPARTTG